MANVPAEAKQPEDHKQKAVKAEADGDGYIEFEYSGTTYRLPADPQDWPVRVTRAYEHDRQADSAALLMESEEYDVDDWTNRKLNDLMTEYGKKAGFVQGES
jgi:hypothetical protein